MGLIHNLWHDDVGAVISTELTLVLGVVVMGVSGGLAALRNKANAGLGSVVDPVQDVIQQSAADAKLAMQTPPPYVAKSLSTATANSSSGSSASVNLVVNVQYPQTRFDLPSP